MQSLELQKAVAQTWSWCSLCSAPPDISHRCSHCCLHPSCKAVQCPSELCAKWEHSSREAAKAQEWKPCNKSQEIGFYWFAGGLFFFFYTIEITHRIMLNAKYFTFHRYKCISKSCRTDFPTCRGFQKFHLYSLYLSSLVVICSDAPCHAQKLSISLKGSPVC